MGAATTPKGGAAGKGANHGTLAGAEIVVLPVKRRNTVRALERATLIRFANAPATEWREIWTCYLHQRREREQRQRMDGAS